MSASPPILALAGNSRVAKHASSSSSRTKPGSKAAEGDAEAAAAEAASSSTAASSSSSAHAAAKHRSSKKEKEKSGKKSKQKEKNTEAKKKKNNKNKTGGPVDGASSAVHGLVSASTTTAAAAAVPGETEEDYEGYRSRVEAACAVYPNSVCADCGQNGTRWAVVNYGVFVCIRCSGVHRSLGTHVSKVKSTNMDRWTLAEACLMEAVGNARAGQLLQADGTPCPPRGSSDAVVRAFISDKYVHRRFAAADWAKEYKRYYKKVGYGPYAGRQSRKPQEPAEGKSADGRAGETEAAAVALERDEAIKALYGNSAGIGEAAQRERRRRQQQRAQTVHGTFGAVNVDPDDYESHLARLLHFFRLHDQPQSPVKGAKEQETAAQPTETAVGDNECKEEEEGELGAGTHGVEAETVNSAPPEKVGSALVDEGVTNEATVAAAVDVESGVETAPTATEPEPAAEKATAE